MDFELQEDSSPFTFKAKFRILPSEKCIVGVTVLPLDHMTDIRVKTRIMYAALGVTRVLSEEN